MIQTREHREQAAQRFSRMLREAIPTRVTRQTVTEWAEENRVLSHGLSPFPGPFRWQLTPYLREIADCLSETSNVQKVAVQKGSQLGFTVGILENFLGYVVAAAPGPTLYITGDAGMAQSLMSRRIDSLILNAGLGDKIHAEAQGRKTRKTGNTQVEKQFAGGFIRAIGPNSATKLRQDSIRYLLLDELDAYPETAAKEGSPIALAERRSDAFESTRKIAYISTPLFEHNSQIKLHYLKGDQRLYYVPCKHCGAMQPLKWSQLKFEQNEEERLIWDSVHYECEHCGGAWKNSDKAWFLPRGEWRATAEPQEPGFRSYHLSGLYSPVGFRSWESGVQEFLEAGDDRLALQVFTNTFRGEAFRDYREQPRLELLLTRDRTYHIGTLPEDARPFFVTIGADVHKDSIHFEVIAWARDKVNWSIDYRIVEGDTADLDSEPWEALREAMETEWAGYRVMLAGIDAGYRTDTVFDFASEFEAGVVPVMGYETLGRGREYIHVKGRKSGTGGIVVDLNTDLLKQEIMRQLRKEKAAAGDTPGGYTHFPVEYSRKHIQKLTNEARVLKVVGGRQKMVWDRGGRQNEPIDTRTYALGMVYALKYHAEQEYGLNPGELPWTDFWDYAEAQYGQKESDE